MYRHPGMADSTLRSLYPRAARAFVQKDWHLTASLIDSVFPLLNTDDQKRKWEMLRITFETTIYSSSTSTLPPSWQHISSLSPQDLLNSLYSRSLSLFSNKLPSQILVNLVLASLKLDSPLNGKAMIQDWLPNQSIHDAEYDKVIDLYCLHVLPRLDQYDLARQFIRSNSQITKQRKSHLLRSLKATQSIITPSPPSDNSSTSSSSSPASSPLRPASPSSSVSSTSTHTARPFTSLSVTSLASTITPPPPLHHPPLPSITPHYQLHHNPQPPTSLQPALNHPTPPRDPPYAGPNTVAIIAYFKSSILPLLRRLFTSPSRSRILLLLLFLLFPFFAWFIARRKVSIANESAADRLRRRLRSRSKLFSSAPAIRSILDSFRMASSL